MKKIIVLTGVLVTLCLSSLNAQTKAQGASFNRTFSDAANVRWEQVNAEIALARFGSSLAYFNQSGDLLMSGKHITLNQSPENVQKSLATLAASLEKKEGTLRVIHVYQLTQQSATKYYVNMGNESAFVAVMVSESGRAKVIKRSKIDSRIEGPIVAGF